MKIIKSATLDSIEATIIDVEATFTKGMPSFTIVGMVSTSIKVSKDSVNYQS
jgi:magnesium chelatase family protein